VYLFKANRDLCLLILLPLCFGVIAASLHMYPMQGRLTLDAAAPLTLLVSCAIAECFTNPAKQAWMGWIFYGGSVLLPTMECAAILQQRPVREEVRSCLEILVHQAKPIDSIYVCHLAIPAVTFYRT
jgi:hypothetical protein